MAIYQKLTNIPFFIKVGAANIPLKLNYLHNPIQDQCESN